MKKEQKPSGSRKPKENVVAYPGKGAAAKAQKLSGVSASRPKSKSKTSKKKIPPLYIWGDFDVPFLILTLALLGFGLVMLFSSSYVRGYYYENNSFYYIKKQMFYSVIGVTAMMAASVVDYHWIEKFTWPLYFGSILLCGMCYLFDPYQGAQRWIYIKGFSFQPSEIGKFALILVLAHVMDRESKRMDHIWYGTIRNLIYFAIMAVVVLPQPHISATVILAAITGVMIFAGGCRLKHLFGIGVTGVGAIALAIFVFWNQFSEKFGHALVRLRYWLDPFATQDAGAYQTKQSLMAIGSGGLMGVGLGESRQKQLYLPEVQNDFVFAIVCEELGFVGAALIIILFAMLIWRGYTIALHAKDRLGMLIAVGITTQIGLQAMLNIAVVTNTLPNTGISLPLFSFGGTSLCMILGELGILLSISRQGVYEKE